MGCELCPFDYFGKEIEIHDVGISIDVPLCSEGKPI